MAELRPLATLNRSAATLKTNFGRIEARLGAHMLLYTQVPSRQRREEMEIDIRKFRESNDKIIYVYNDIMDQDDNAPRNVAYAVTLQEYGDRYTRVTAEVTVAFTDADAEEAAADTVAAAANVAAIATAGANAQNRPRRVDTSLKPKNLVVVDG